MTIEWLRDLIIIICGIIATGVLVVVAVLMVMIASRLKKILDSARRTTNTVEEVTSYVSDEVIKPAAQIAAVIQGLGKGLAAFKKKKGDKK